MMQAWTPEGMAFLQDAMACCGYYPALARRIAPYLPKQAHVCDAGCGLGGLSVALLPYCRHVTAVDRAAAPLENLRQRARCGRGISVACRRKRPTTPWCSACSAAWRRR